MPLVNLLDGFTRNLEQIGKLLNEALAWVDRTFQALAAFVESPALPFIFALAMVCAAALILGRFGGIPLGLVGLIVGFVIVWLFFGGNIVSF